MSVNVGKASVETDGEPIASLYPGEEIHFRIIPGALSLI